MSDASKAVFLSYASQDTDAARHIAESLRASGVEVWFDVEGGLEHGDEWDAKIRRQIKECVLFIPLISANTQAREEGYFRIEWELAAERAMGFATGTAFILPVVIDDTREPAALVPDRFRKVQWTRLPGGVVPPDVQARFLKLWSHRTGVLKQEAAGTPVRETLPERPETTPAGRYLLTFVALPLAVAAGWYFAVRPALKSPTEALGAVAPDAKVAVSEVDRLLGQIWDLVYHHGMARAELEAADQLCRRAVELDVTKADVWAAWAHVHTWLIFHRFDETDTRRLAGQDAAARAMRLAPHSFEARLAQAVFWLRGKGASETQIKESELALRVLLREKPEDSRVQFLLGFSLLKEAQTWDEGVELLKRSAGNPQMASVAWMELGWSHYFGARFTEAERAIDQSIAAGAYWNNCALKTRLALQWHGDLAAAKMWLEKLPPADLQHDFVVTHQFMLYMWRREPQRVIPLLQNHPREWLSSNPYQGPKSLLLGLARRMAGQETAAGKEFRLALALIEARLRDNPNDGDLLSQKAEVLYYLEDRPAADAACRQVREVSSLSLSLRVLFDPADSVIEFLEGSFDRPDLLQPSATTAASFRLDPLYDTIRKHPRFQALIARAEASPQHNPAPLSSLPAASAQSVADAKSVAVLAFANLSDDKENEYFSDGISEELLNVLAKVPGLKVAARTSAFYFKGRNLPIAEIAHQLGVAYVIEGSIRKSGAKVRITAQLIKAADGFHVWSDNFDREVKDIFAVQDEIAGMIARKFQLETATTATGGTTKPEAHRLYLEGKFFLNQFALESAKQAQRLFQQAVELDPEFALSWAALARAGIIRGNYGMTRQEVEDGYTLARKSAERALALNPDLLEGLLALAEVKIGRDFDWNGAEVLLNRARTLAPTDAGMISGLSRLAYTRGQIAEAIRLGAQAVELDPVNPAVRVNYGFGLNAAGRFDEAAEQGRRIAEINPNAPWGHVGVSLNASFQGQFDRAIKEANFETVEWTRLFALSIALWGQAKTAEADAQLDQLIQKYADVAAYQVAEVYAFRRQADQAFEWLDRAYQQRDPGLGWSKPDVLLKNLHLDSRWEKFMRQLGLTDAI